MSYPEQRTDKTRTVVIVFEDEMTDEALRQLEFIELSEMEITILHGFDENVKVLAEVPDGDVEELKTYWKEAINEVIVCPCCYGADEFNKYYDEDGNENEVQIPPVYEVITLSEFKARDSEGQYADEVAGLEELI
jgi:hypothetical protein